MPLDRSRFITSPTASGEVACAGCFLREQTGGRCPMAQDASEWDQAEARHRAELLRGSVLTELPAAPSLTELVRIEARQGGRGSPCVVQRALPPATAESIPDDSRKEVGHDAASRPIR
jgi:hypothetical protein